MESSFNDDEGEGILLPLQGNRDLLSVVEPPNDHGLEECALTFAQMNEVQQRLLELSADASANISGPTGSAIEIADGKQCIDVDNGVGENGGENQEQALQDAAKEALQLRKLQSIFDEAPLVDQTVADFNFTIRTCNSEEVSLRIQQSPLLAARLGGTNECSAKEAIGPCSTEVESATGAVVWDSTVVLARLVEQAAHSESLSFISVEGRHCVELGAGCGLAKISKVVAHGPRVLHELALEDLVGLVRRRRCAAQIFEPTKDGVSRAGSDGVEKAGAARATSGARRRQETETEP